MSRGWALFALLLCGVAVGGPPAGGFTLSPVRLEMASGAQAVSMVLSNGADRTKTVQVEAFRWTQAEGIDHYEPAPDLVVNPPLFRVAPGARQVVRVGFRNGAPAGAVESAYRLYVQEIPDGDEAPAQQLRLLLRIGVPLFVAPAQAGASRPHWELVRRSDGSLALEVLNQGNRRLRLDELSLVPQTGPALALAGLSYVLPGQARAWPLPSGVEGPLRVAASSDAGPLDVALPGP